jgi:hypothetical protein
VSYAGIIYRTAGKKSYHRFSVGQEEARLLVFFQDDTRSTLSMNVNSQNDMLAVRKSPRSTRSFLYITLKCREYSQSQRVHVFEVTNSDHYVTLILIPLFEELTEERKVDQFIRFTR